MPEAAFNIEFGQPTVTGELLHLVGADSSALRLVIDAFNGSSSISLRKAQGTASAPTAIPADVASAILV